MHSSRGNTDRTLRGDRRNQTSRLSTRDFTDWLKGHAQKYTAKELADITGLSVKAAENIRAGLAGASGTTLSTWCMNDKLFAGAYAEYVGLIRPGHAEFVARVSQAVLASQRLHMGGDAE